MENNNDFAKAMHEVNKALHRLSVAILAESGEDSAATEGQTVNHTVIIICQGGPEPDAPTGNCSRCLCNTCDGLDTCTLFPWKDGSIYPPPCNACKGKPGPLVPDYGRACSRYRRTREEGGGQP